MEIRLAKEDDLKEIVVLLKKLDFKHIENRNDVKTLISNERYKRLILEALKGKGFVFIVSEIKTKIVGFALGKTSVIRNHFIFKNQIIGEVLYLAVNQKFKRMGVARKLIGVMEIKLNEKGADKIEMIVYNFNKEAFPERGGYEKKYTIYEKFF